MLLLSIGEENMPNKRNIYLIGPMGAGKTSIGRKLAQELGLDFYDSDQVIEDRTGADIPWIFDIEGEEGFREREIKVISELTELPGIVLATGGTVIAAPENCQALSNGVIVYLKTTPDNQMNRTSRSKKRPIPALDVARKATLSELRDKYGKVYEELADFSYETDNRTVAGVAHAIIEQLQERKFL
jgi:shikimate kinase